TTFAVPEQHQHKVLTFGIIIALVLRAIFIVLGAALLELFAVMFLLFVVLLAIGSTDILFALDSIPAVFGVTAEPYIVFVANAFALLGLRALFFLVKGLLDRLVYLSTGLAIILGFIGAKLILHWAHSDISTSVPEIGTPV